MAGLILSTSKLISLSPLRTIWPLYMAGEAVPIHGDCIQTDVEEDLGAVRDAKSDCMVGAGHGGSHDCVCR